MCVRLVVCALLCACMGVAVHYRIEGLLVCE